MSRGPHQKDARLFSPDALPLLHMAAEEVAWLLGRNYPMQTVVDFVGSRHQLQARQRTALTRSVCSDAVRQARLDRQRSPASVAGQPLLIDGFNLIITLEVALAGGVILQGHDGALRDLAGLRGTYRLHPLTSRALDLIGQAFEALRPAKVVWYLDRPVSNSGRLRERIAATATDWPMPNEVSLVPDPDRILVGQPGVVSADAVVIDSCASWVNLLGWIIDQHVPSAWRVPMSAQVAT